MPADHLTPEEVRRVLRLLGMRTVDDLFASIPPRVRENAEPVFDFGHGIDGSHGVSETELEGYFDRVLAANRVFPPRKSFVGGGTGGGGYDEPVPAVVRGLVARSEFLHAAMPMVPARDQGALQGLYEFQRVVERLVGLGTVMAPSGDLGTAVTDACFAAVASAGGAGHGVLLAGSLPSPLKDVVRTALTPHPPGTGELRWNAEGTVDLEHLAEQLQVFPACAVVVGYPNRFGIVEPLARLRAALPEPVRLVAVAGDAMVFSQFEAPGALGADLVAGDTQGWGAEPAYGSGSAGYLAGSDALRANLPGWTVTELAHSGAQRFYDAFVPTNEPVDLVTNLTAAIRSLAFLLRLGPEALAGAGERNHSRFAYLSHELQELGIPRRFPSAPHFREGVFEIPNLDHRYRAAVARGLHPGLRFEPGVPGDFSSSLLITCHGHHSRSDLDSLVEVLTHD